MENMKINVLGTEYKIETHKVSEDKYLEENNLAGYCGEESKLIVVADMSEEKYFDLSEEEQKSYRKKTLRHEIVHAFLNESGLSDSSNQYNGGWAKNEEMVDWLAIQWHKIDEVYKQLGI